MQGAVTDLTTWRSSSPKWLHRSTRILTLVPSLDGTTCRRVVGTHRRVGHRVIHGLCYRLAFIAGASSFVMRAWLKRRADGVMVPRPKSKPVSANGTATLHVAKGKRLGRVAVSFFLLAMCSVIVLIVVSQGSPWHTP